MNEQMIFTVSENGYWPGDVDQYVEKLSDEYDSLYSQYMRLIDEYNEQARECLRVQNANRALMRDSDRLAKLQERNEVLQKTLDDVRSSLRMLFDEETASEAKAV